MQPYVELGFRPAMVWIKEGSGSTSWRIFLVDNGEMILLIQATNLYLRPNEGENGDLDDTRLIS